MEDHTSADGPGAAAIHAEGGGSANVNNARGISLDGGQAGDITISGISPEALADLQEVQMRLIDALERSHGVARDELGRLAKLLGELGERFGMYQQLVSNRMAADARRAATDRLLALAALVLGVVAIGLAVLR